MPDVQPERIDLETAERISSVLEDVARPGLRHALKASASEQVRDGFLEVRLTGDAMVCRYDPEVADVERWQGELTRRLGERDAGLVRFVPVARRPAELLAIETVLHDGSWHPDANAVGRTFSIDWEREVVDVGLEEGASEDVVAELRRIGGDAIVVRTGGRMSRGRGSKGPR